MTFGPFQISQQHMSMLASDSKRETTQVTSKSQQIYQVQPQEPSSILPQPEIANIMPKTPHNTALAIQNHKSDKHPKLVYTQSNSRILQMSQILLFCLLWACKFGRCWVPWSFTTYVKQSLFWAKLLIFSYIWHL